MELNKIILTDDQKELIKNIWNNAPQPPSIKYLVFKVFNISENQVNIRGEEGMAIRDFISTSGIKNNGAPKKEIELIEVDKEFIDNNAAHMTANEMARLLFKNKTLMVGSRETRAVLAYIKTLNPDLVPLYEKPAGDFKPPRKFPAVVKLVNSVVLDAFDVNKLENDKLDGDTKRKLEACIKYFNNKRFVKTIESYSNADDQDEFVDHYVRHVYDKIDLNQQDLDVICLFSEEVIHHKQLKDHLNSLMDIQRDKINADDKLTMSIVESISSANRDIDKSVKMQKDLLSEINEKRSARLKNKIERNGSLLNLVDLWSQEEGRNKLIDVADEYSEKVKTEIKKMSNLDQIKISIFGATEDELQYG